MQFKLLHNWIIASRIKLWTRSLIIHAQGAVSQRDLYSNETARVMLLVFHASLQRNMSAGFVWHWKCITIVYTRNSVHSYYELAFLFKDRVLSIRLIVQQHPVRTWLSVRKCLRWGTVNCWLFVLVLYSQLNDRVLTNVLLSYLLPSLSSSSSYVYQYQYHRQHQH